MGGAINCCKKLTYAGSDLPIDASFEAGWCEDACLQQDAERLHVLICGPLTTDTIVPMEDEKGALPSARNVAKKWFHCQI